MKIIERLLIALSLILCVAIAGLGLFWAGTALKMVALGSPVAEKTRINFFTSASMTETDVSNEEQASTEIAKVAAEPTATAASAVAGEKVFKKCKACHGAEADSGNKTGPTLWGVVGRPVASIAGFDYSDVLKSKSGQTWDVSSLQAFLEKPKSYAPGTKMTFAGLKKETDRNNVIAYLGQQSDAPQDSAALGFAVAAAGTANVVTASGEVEAEAVEAEVVEIDPVPYPEGVTYRNPPEATPERKAEIEALAAELEAIAPTIDYERARFNPLHFPPAAATASNEECLVCHQEILDRKPLSASPAGVDIDQTLAWYQTLDTYSGDQQTFHYRHLKSEYANEVMNLQCNFCHKGNDPREESPDMVPTRAALSASASPEFTLRKMVNPSETCLRCHGSFPYENMELEGPWHEIRADMEWPEAPNGCLSCHAESYRTVRHQVNYLNSENIERIAREGSSDSCYGCHGGRAWYRISYPYPRHPWPDMDTEIPEWAVDRPTESDAQYALPTAE